MKPVVNTIARDEILAVVPARGGSKGLPRKNLCCVAGVPLLEWTIRAGIESGVCGRICITTDDDEIAAVGQVAGAEVVRRPPELALDDTPTVDAVLHLLDMLAFENYHPKVIVLLQPTSPLRHAGHVREAVELYLARSPASLIGVTEWSHHPYKALAVDTAGFLSPLFGSRDVGAPRQTLPHVLRQSGGIYVVGATELKAARSFLVQPALGYLMDKVSSIDIDTAEDLAYAEWLLTDLRKSGRTYYSA